MSMCRSSISTLGGSSPRFFLRRGRATTPWTRSSFAQDLDTLREQHLGRPAADGAEPDQALVVDVGDDQSDLVDVADDGEQRAVVAPCTRATDDRACRSASANA